MADPIQAPSNLPPEVMRLSESPPSEPLSVGQEEAVAPSNLPPEVMRLMEEPSAPETFQVYMSNEGKAAFYDPVTQSVQWLSKEAMGAAWQTGLEPISGHAALREAMIREDVRKSPYEAVWRAWLSSASGGAPELTGRVFDPGQLERMQYAREEHPWLSLVGDVGGFVTTLGAAATGKALVGAAGKISESLIGQGAGKVASTLAGPKSVALLGEGALAGVPVAGREVAQTKNLTPGKVFEIYAEELAITGVINRVTSPLLEGVILASGKQLKRFKAKTPDAAAEITLLEAEREALREEAVNLADGVTTKKQHIYPAQNAVTNIEKQLGRNTVDIDEVNRLSGKLVDESAVVAKAEGELYQRRVDEKFVKDHYPSLTDEPKPPPASGVAGTPPEAVTGDMRGGRPIPAAPADTIPKGGVAATAETEIGVAPARVVGEGATPKLSPMPDEAAARFRQGQPMEPELFVDTVMDSVTGPATVEGVTPEVASIKIAQLDDILRKAGLGSEAEIKAFRVKYQLLDDEMKRIRIKEYVYDNRKMPTGALADELEIVRLRKGGKFLKNPHPEVGWGKTLPGETVPVQKARFLKHKANVEAQIDAESKLLRLIEEREAWVAGKGVAPVVAKTSPGIPIGKFVSPPKTMPGIKGKDLAAMERTIPGQLRASINRAGLRSNAELGELSTERFLKKGTTVREYDLYWANLKAQNTATEQMLAVSPVGQRAEKMKLKEYASLVRDNFPEATVDDIAKSYNNYRRGLQPKSVYVDDPGAKVAYASERRARLVEKEEAKQIAEQAATAEAAQPKTFIEPVDESQIPLRVQVRERIRRLETTRSVEELEQLIGQGEVKIGKIHKRLDPLQVRLARAEQLQLKHIDAVAALKKLQADRFTNEESRKAVRRRIIEVGAQISGARKALKAEHSKTVARSLMGSAFSSMLGSAAGISYATEHALMGFAGGGVVGFVLGRLATGIGKRVFSPNGKLASAFIKAADKAAAAVTSMPMRASMLLAIEKSVSDTDPDEVYHDTLMGCTDAGAPESSAITTAEVSAGKVRLIQAALEDPSRVSKENTIRAVLFPNAMVARISRGSHTPEDLKVFQELYPETFADLIRTAKEILDEYGEDMKLEEVVSLKRLVFPPEFTEPPNPENPGNALQYSGYGMPSRPAKMGVPRLSSAANSTTNTARIQRGVGSQ